MHDRFRISRDLVNEYMDELKLMPCSTAGVLIPLHAADHGTIDKLHVQSSNLDQFFHLTFGIIKVNVTSDEGKLLSKWQLSSPYLWATKLPYSGLT